VSPQDHPVTLDFIAGQLQRVLSELRTLRDDVDVLSEIARRHDASFDRLEERLDTGLAGVRSEMREIRAELRAMNRQQQRTAARVRAVEERST
jgi:hypothetical protein